MALAAGQGRWAQGGPWGWPWALHLQQWLALSGHSPELMSLPGVRWASPVGSGPQQELGGFTASTSASEEPSSFWGCCPSSSGLGASLASGEPCLSHPLPGIPLLLLTLSALHLKPQSLLCLLTDSSSHLSAFSESSSSFSLFLMAPHLWFSLPSVISHLLSSLPPEALISYSLYPL